MDEEDFIDLIIQSQLAFQRRRDLMRLINTLNLELPSRGLSRSDAYWYVKP